MKAFVVLGQTATPAGYATHCAGAMRGWKFSNSKDGVFAEYCHVTETDADKAETPDNVTVF